MPVSYYRDVSAASPPGPPTHIGSAGRSASRRLGDSQRRVCLSLGRERSAARPAVHPGGQFRFTSPRRDEPGCCRAQIDGFAATTLVSAMVQEPVPAQVTRQLPAIQGAVTGTPGVAAKTSKQALIGALPTPNCGREATSAVTGAGGCIKGGHPA